MSIFRLKLNPSLTEIWLLARAIFEEEIKASCFENAPKLERIKASIQDEFAAHLLEVHRKRCETCPTPSGSERQGLRPNKDCCTGEGSTPCGYQHARKKYVSTSTQTSMIGVHSDSGGDESVLETSLPFSRIHEGGDNRVQPGERGGILETRDIQSQLMAAQDDWDVTIKQEEDCDSYDTVESSMDQPISPDEQQDVESSVITPESSDVAIKMEEFPDDEYRDDYGETDRTSQESLPGPSDGNVAYTNAGESSMLLDHQSRTSHHVDTEVGGDNDGTHQVDTDKETVLKSTNKSRKVSELHKIADRLAYENRKRHRADIRDQYQMGMGSSLDVPNTSTSGESTLRCSLCNKTISDGLAFNAGIDAISNTQTQSQSEPNQLYCVECWEKVTMENKPRQYAEIRKEGGRYHCPTCGKGFDLRKACVAHMSVHTGEKPYECPVCYKRFRQKGNVKSHMVSHGMGSKHRCPICSKCFASNPNLVNHIRIHTGEQPYKCTMCSKTYTQQGDLKRHLIKHEESLKGDKRFYCPVCERFFVSRDLYLTHMAIHSGEKPFECEVCKKRYKKKYLLKSHMASHGLG